MWKNNLDEMKELELLKIEHRGMWLAFWGLLASILLQIILGFGFRQIMGEWIVFMVLCLYVLVACTRKGIWDRYLKPNIKTNLVLSLIAAAAVCGAAAARGNWAATAALPLGTVILGAITFGLCFALLTVCGKLYARRKAKLNGEAKMK